MIGKGRNVLLTSYKEINSENVINVVRDAMQLHRDNAEDCEFLLNFASGEQPLIRKEDKKVMTWIDCEAVDNVALEISDFWRGFGWGNPITLVQRGDIKNPEGKADGIAELNYCYAATGNSRDLQTMANFIVKCGHCFTIVDYNTEYEEGDSYFTRDVVDPRWAFVVRSTAYADRRVVLGVTLNVVGDDYYFTAHTKDSRYDIQAVRNEIPSSKVKKEEDYFEKFFTWNKMETFGVKNPLGIIPVIEWYWEPERVGVFENQINALNNINLMASDISNGIEQNIQSLWWTNNVEFEKEVITNEDGTETEVVKKPANGDWIHTKTAREGVNPSIQPLVMDYHIKDMLDSFTEMRSLVLQKCHVPQRNDTSGGSSGVAMDSASGWADAESVASSREEVVKGCQMDEVRVVLKAIKSSPAIAGKDSELLKLYPNDVQPAIRRPKNYDLATKANAITTLLSHGFALEDAVSNVPLFSDATQVIQRSGDGVKKYQETIFSQANDAEAAPNADRTMQDLSDQTDRSSLLNK